MAGPCEWTAKALAQRRSYRSGDPVTSYTLDILVGDEDVGAPDGSVGGGSPQSPTTTFTVN